MARKSPIANESDPSLLRQIETQLSSQPRAIQQPNINSSEVVFPLATQRSTNSNVTITQSVNNDSGDIVTVYNTEGTISVTSIDQTVNEYKTVNSGVSQVVAGENVTISSTQGNGVGIVTISVGTDFTDLTLTKFNETVIDGGTVSGSIEPDASLGTIYKYTLEDGIILDSIANAVAGTSMTIILKQDATGGHSIISSEWYWSGNNQALTSSANAVDIVSVFYDGTDYYAALSNNFVQYVPV